MIIGGHAYNFDGDCRFTLNVRKKTILDEIGDIDRYIMKIQSACGLLFGKIQLNRCSLSRGRQLWPNLNSFRS